VLLSRTEARYGRFSRRPFTDETLSRVSDEGFPPEFALIFQCLRGGTRAGYPIHKSEMYRSKRRCCHACETPTVCHVPETMSIGPGHVTVTGEVTH
jgi:hypothetical protein